MTFAQYLDGTEALYLSASGQAVPVLEPLQSLCAFHSRRIAIVAPHPDDECLMAGFALRAKEEWGAQVSVIPYSFGSAEEKRSNRKKELTSALQILEFSLVDPRLEGADHELSHAEITLGFRQIKPDTIILPHALDGHPAHQRCAQNAWIAAADWAHESGETVNLLHSEFWQSQADANLCVPLSKAELLKMGEGLLAHAGEVARNPYHLTLPAWCMDQARRGAELHKGSAKSQIIFAQLYRHETLNPS